MFLRIVRAAGGHSVKHEYVRVVEASDLLISDGCDWSGVIAKLFAKSMRPTRKAGWRRRYDAESRGFWDDGWVRGAVFFFPSSGDTVPCPSFICRCFRPA